MIQRCDSDFPEQRLFVVILLEFLFFAIEFIGMVTSLKTDIISCDPGELETGDGLIDILQVTCFQKSNPLLCTSRPRNNNTKGCPCLTTERI